jgi:hypothetical protein
MSYEACLYKHETVDTTFFPMAQQPLGLLWTSDQPDAETST